MSQSGQRRNFLKKILSVAGVSMIPGAPALAKTFEPSKKVQFVTHFPHAMTLPEYREFKKQFENKDKVTTLLSVFKKSGKILSEDFSFHGTHSVWIVEFKTEAHYNEWMTITEELESHKDSDREMAGFRLEIRTLA